VQPPRARRPLELACAAAIVATIGDLLLLWAGNALRPELALAPPPSFALPLGGALGVLAIPLYAVGYRALAREVERTSDLLARVVAFSGLGIGLVGALIHGLTASLILRAIGSGASPAAPLESVAAEGGLLVAAWTVAGMSVLAASLALLLASFARACPVPRWLAWLNPVTLAFAFGLAGAASELGRSFLVPAAPNLAHVGFFALALFAPRRRSSLA
jgi:hypothetical protein